MEEVLRVSGQVDESLTSIEEEPTTDTAATATEESITVDP